MSYLLDTNVISELRKSNLRRDPHVAAWTSARQSATFYLSAITVLELELGTLRKERIDPAQGAVLRHWLQTAVIPSFAGRILAVDLAVAQVAAGLHVPDPRAERDALIAATAVVHGLNVVTRNVKDFAVPGLAVIDPWVAED